MLREESTLPERDVHIYPPSPARLDSFLLCVDPATGKNIWKMPRAIEENVAVEAAQSYATPYPWEPPSGPPCIVTIGGGFTMGQDWQTGKELWRVHFNKTNPRPMRVIPTPVGAGEVLVAGTPRAMSVFGLRLAGGQAEEAWDYTAVASDAPSPLYYQGKLFILSDKKRQLACLDPKTGKELWSGPLGGTADYDASPTGADGKIYVMNLSAEVVILDAGDQFKILGRVKMPLDPKLKSSTHRSPSTIVAAGSELFIRTADALWCIGKK
jgi:outer membrane protein assembly factor BamB